MGTIHFDVKAQLERLTNGKIEVLLDAGDGLYQSPTDWETTIVEKYKDKFQGEDKRKVSDLLAMFAKMKKKEPLFKKKVQILEQQKLLDKPVSAAWKEINQKGMAHLREQLRRQHGLDYVDKRFVTIK